MSLQVDIKKKIMKGKKPIYKSTQFAQNNKKTIKLSDHCYNNNINMNNKSENINNAKIIIKLQEELNIYKTKSQKLEEEIIQLNFKLKEMTEKNENMKLKKEEEKNSEEDNSSNSFSNKKKTNSLKKAICSAYEILIELIELILNQKNYNKKDKDVKIENISMDMYESSVYNDEERKALLFEQIQQILIFKINFINKKYNLGLEKQCERIKNWNINTINITKDNIKDISFSSFSAFSNNKKRSLNISMNNSDIGSAIGISPHRSPKFQGQGRRDSYSAISNLMDESTIKDFSTSIINYNNANHNGLGGDSFFFENENLSKSKEDIDNKEQLKTKEINLINTSFKDLSLIRSGDEQVGNISFNKDTNNNEGEEKEDSNNDVNKNKEIIIKDENKLNISFNDI
jgi:hypothetical protein